MKKGLLDECVPLLLKDSLQGFEVFTVQEMGWSEAENGELIRLAEGRFDVLLTVDRNLPYQQNLRGLSLAVLILAVPNRVADILPYLAEVRGALDAIRPGDVVVIRPT